MRKLFIKFSIVLLLSQLSLSLSLPASIAAGESPLETAPLSSDSFQPAIDGDKVVYLNGFADGSPAHSNVYLKTIGGGAPQKLSTVKHAHAPAIAGGRIVWEDLRNDASGPETDNSDMFGYALPAGPETAIDTNTAAQLNPDTSGGRFVWADNRNGDWDIYLKDTNGSVSRITTDTGDQTEPRIDGDLIVWTDHRNGNDDIYLYNIASATETRITDNSANQNGPAISGRKIVWTDWRSTRNTYIYDLDDPVANGAAVDPSPYVQHSARISGNRVVWTDWRNEAANPGYNSDIYAKNLITSETVRITYNSWQQNSPDISGNRIVWADWREGLWRIYLYEFAAPTGTISINNGDPYTSSSSVTLNLTTNGGAEMSLSTDTVAWTPWEPYPGSNSKAYTLSSGDGTKTVYVKFRDADSESAGTISDSIGLDTGMPVDPVTTSTPAPGAWVSDNTINVNWSGASDGAGSGIDGYSVSWTPNASATPDQVLDLQESAGSTTSASLTDGIWWFNLRTKDNAGNWTSTVHRGPFMVDAATPTNPTSTIETSGALSGIWQNAVADSAFNWSGAADAASGVKGYYYYWGAGPTGTPTTWTASPTLDPPASATGTYYLRVKTEDYAGNQSAAATLFTFKYDGSVPTDPTITTSTPAPGAWANDNTVNVDWSGASDAGSGIDGYSVSWSQNTTGVPDQVLDLQETAATTASAPLADGIWYFNLRTKDNAGNWTSTRHAGPFMIETVMPTNPTTAAETGGAVNGAWQNTDSDPDFSWSGASDGAGSGVKGYYYYWGTDPAGAPTTWSVSPAFNPPAVGGPGSYYLRVKTEDNAGNQSAAVTLFTFNYDAIAPSNSLSATETGGASSNNWQNSISDPNFTWAPGVDSASGVKGYYYYWGPSSTGTPTTWTASPVFDPPPVLNPSTNYLRVMTEDNAGNQSGATTVFIFKYDLSVPSNPTSTTETSGVLSDIWQNTANNPNFTWSGASNGGGGPVHGYYYYWGPSADGTSTSYTTETAFDPPLPVANPSVNYLRVRTKDVADNQADWLTLFTFKYDAQTPADPTITTSTPAPDAWASANTINVNWAGASDGSGSGIDGYSVSWSQNATEPPNMTVDLQETATSAVSPPLADGAWYFHLRTKDNAGNWTSTVHEGPFRIDTGAPSNPTSTTETSGALSGAWQKTVSNPDFSWSGASDGAGSGVKGFYYYWGTDPAGAPTTWSVSPAFNPPAVGGPGSYYLRVKTEDNIGNQSAPETLFTFRYDNVKPVNSAAATETGGAQKDSWQNSVASPNFSWSPGSDGLSGVKGYHYYWGQNIVGAPTDWTTNTVYAPGPIASGTYYLRVKTEDNAGNQSDPALLFIFKYDGDPPPDPSPASSSHTTGLWSGDNTVDLNWIAPLDVSLVAGYSIIWSQSAPALPDMTIDQAAANVTSPPRADGIWYFNLRTKDTAGNWSSGTNAGPFKIDATAPSASISSPAISTNVSKTKTFPVVWSGVDSGSGVASYDVQYKVGSGGVWTVWKNGTTAKSADFTIGIPGKTYYFRALAKDAAGNTGAWTAAVVKTIVPLDQSSKAIIAKRVGFAGTLSKASSGHYLGTVRYSTVAGEYIAYKATGNYFALITDKGKGRGKAAIYVDGKLKKIIDTGAKSTKYRQVVYSISFTTVGKHTLKIVNKGTAGRPRINLDGLAVGN